MISVAENLRETAGQAEHKAHDLARPGRYAVSAMLAGAYIGIGGVAERLWPARIGSPDGRTPTWCGPVIRPTNDHFRRSGKPYLSDAPHRRRRGRGLSVLD
ncbi:hypothetical protein [Streptomyces sp. NPDC056169]|uniref:hypothetical protein n=1 Tax=Streptomyces sp. NPDC056169 TaxID=3345734 RepID=UPI0035DED17D